MMRHKGGTPAIYASRHRAHLVMPNESISTHRANLILGHADEEVLRVAYEESTQEDFFKTARLPKNPRDQSYLPYLEQVFTEAWNRLRPDAAITPEGFRILRHSLGASQLSTGCPNLGWRNYFAAGEGHDDEPEIVKLVEAGMMIEASPGFYRCTIRGMRVAGMSVEQIETAGSK